MISQLRGTVIQAGATSVVLDLSGFGVTALCPPATAASVRVGEQALLHTSLVVREDSLTLYGFAGATERDAFELVQTATGVGPKLAQAIVSVLSPVELVQAISTENLTRLCAVPGIGRKGAQKLVIELKDRVATLGVDSIQVSERPPTHEQWREQVVEGLVGLGWSARDAEAACDRVAHLTAENPDVGVAVLMRAALKSLAR